MITFENCKICDEKGEEIYSKQYDDDFLKKYFEDYYGLKAAKIIYMHLKNKKYQVLKCSKCKFMWQKNQPDKNFANKLYEEIIDKDKSFIKSEEMKKKRELRFKSEHLFLYNYFNKKINILDYGAGWGSWLSFVQSDKCNLFALEFSSSRKKYLKKIGVQVIDNISNEEYINFFDYIRLEQVLEHVTDLNIIINSLKKICSKKTIIHIGVPNGKKEINNTGNNFIKKGPIQPLEHVNCFTNQSLKKLLDKFGFKPLTLKEIILTHLKSNQSISEKYKFLFKDLIDNVFSTSVKFILKSN